MTMLDRDMDTQARAIASFIILGEDIPDHPLIVGGLYIFPSDFLSTFNDPWPVIEEYVANRLREEVGDNFFSFACRYLEFFHKSCDIDKLRNYSFYLRMSIIQPKRFTRYYAKAFVVGGPSLFNMFIEQNKPIEVSVVSDSAKSIVEEQKIEVALKSEPKFDPKQDGLSKPKRKVKPLSQKKHEDKERSSKEPEVDILDRSIVIEDLMLRASPDDYKLISEKLFGKTDEGNNPF